MVPGAVVPRPRKSSAAAASGASDPGDAAPDGAWETYRGAPNGDINTTVEAYAALRSMGHRDDEPALVRARDWIASKGGLRNVRVFTRYWLALIGEWPWEKTPNIPPEVIWFPKWFTFSIYNFAPMGASDLDAAFDLVGAPAKPSIRS